MTRLVRRKKPSASPSAGRPSPQGIKIERPSQVLDTRVGPASTEPPTVVIFGLPRGGTTMVAGIAQRTGVDIGADLPVNLEDPDFNGQSLEHMTDAIRRNNQTKALWGWKYPLAAQYLPELHSEIRNPHYVVVCRDLLASSVRSVRRGTDFLDALHGAQRRQQANLEVLTTLPAKHLLVSYEKGLHKPMALARDMARFAGGRVPADPRELRAFATRGSYKS